MAQIKYQKGLVEGTSFAIELSIQSLLTDKASEYDNLLAAFTKSQCDEATAIRTQLAAERAAVNALAEFYKQTLALIRAASNDIDLVEKHYGIEHVTGGN